MADGALAGAEQGGDDGDGQAEVAADEEGEEVVGDGEPAGAVRAGAADGVDAAAAADPVVQLQAGLERGLQGRRTFGLARSSSFSGGRPG